MSGNIFKYFVGDWQMKFGRIIVCSFINCFVPCIVICYPFDPTNGGPIMVALLMNVLGLCISSYLCTTHVGT